MSMSKLDANQVIKSVYSEADGALKTVPAASTSFAIELDADDGDSVEVRSQSSDTVILLDEIDASQDVTSDEINVLNYKSVYLAINWEDLDAADATIQIQGSLDNSFWFDEGAAITLAATPDSELVKMSDCGYKFVRVVYTANTNAAGTVTVKYLLKG